MPFYGQFHGIRNENEETLELSHFVNISCEVVI